MRRSALAIFAILGILAIPLSGHADNPQTPGGAAYGAGVANYPLNKVFGCQLTCGNTATAVACTTPGFTVRSRTLDNTSDTDIYIGSSAVTNAAGFLLKVGKSVTFTVDPNASTAFAVYCAVSGGAKALSVLEGG